MSSGLQPGVISDVLGLMPRALAQAGSSITPLPIRPVSGSECPQEKGGPSSIPVPVAAPLPGAHRSVPPGSLRMGLGAHSVPAPPSGLVLTVVDRGGRWRVVGVVSGTLFYRARSSASLTCRLPSVPTSKVTRCRQRLLFQSCSVWVYFEVTRQRGRGGASWACGSARQGSRVLGT